MDNYGGNMQGNNWGGNPGGNMQGNNWGGNNFGNNPYQPSLPPLGGWYKFLIYFSLWAAAVLNLISGFTIITGAQYEVNGGSAQLVYLAWPGMKGLDIIIGLATFALAVFSVVVRMQLAHCKRNALTYLYALQGANIGITLVYALAATSITGINVITENIASIIGSAVILIVNVVYFSKRKGWFVN